MSKKQQCSHLIGYFRSPCERPATKEENGKWFCCQHCNEHRKAKAAERQRVANEREARLEFQWRRSDLEREAGLKTLTDDELRTIIAAGGIAAIIVMLREMAATSETP